MVHLVKAKFDKIIFKIIISTASNSFKNRFIGGYDEVREHIIIIIILYFLNRETIKLFISTTITKGESHEKRIYFSPPPLTNLRCDKCNFTLDLVCGDFKT